jgi:hypothetical protein
MERHVSKNDLTFIIYRPGARGIRRNITWSDDGNIITEGNISLNPPSGGSINDILYRKLKASMLRIKNLTHTFLNAMLYFRINASIRRFSFESHTVWNINDNIFQNLLQNFEKAPGFSFKIWLFITHQYYYLYFVGHVDMLLSCVLSREVYANNVPPHVPRGTWGGTLSKGTQAR